MGRLSQLWRRVRRGADESGTYECRGCGLQFDRRRQVCPRCESYTIERREW